MTVIRHQIYVFQDNRTIFAMRQPEYVLPNPIINF